MGYVRAGEWIALSVCVTRSSPLCVEGLTTLHRYDRILYVAPRWGETRQGEVHVQALNGTDRVRVKAEELSSDVERELIQSPQVFLSIKTPRNYSMNLLPGACARPLLLSLLQYADYTTLLVSRL